VKKGNLHRKHKKKLASYHQTRRKKMISQTAKTIIRVIREAREAINQKQLDKGVQTQLPNDAAALGEAVAFYLSILNRQEQ
jgi:hypothetical protein